MSTKIFKTQAAQAAHTIKAELKKEFPGIKFSVSSDTYSMGNSVRISWTDGPTTSQVEKICDKYQYGHFNGMEDIYEFSNNRADIPQAKYVQYSRHQSEEIAALQTVLTETLGEGFGDSYHYRPEMILYRIFQKQSFPTNKKILGIERTDINCGSVEDFYKISFEEIKTAKEETAPVNIENSDIKIIDYSEKAVAVIGNTKPIKDKLKELGGMFNFRLSCGAGWIFPKTKLEALQAALIN